MIRLILLAALIGLTTNLPLPDGRIYFPGESAPVDPRSSYSHQPAQAVQRTYYSKTTHRKGGGSQSPIQWPPAGQSGTSYGNADHRVSYSTYGHHPSHMTYSSHSYGIGGSGHHTNPHTGHDYQTYPHSYGGHSHGRPHGESVGQIEQSSYGSSHDGSVEGQIEQISHGNSHGGSVEGQIEQSSHGNSHGGSVGQIEQSSYGSSHGGSLEGQIEQISHGSSHGRSVEGQIEQSSYGSSHRGSLEGQIEQSSYGSSHGGSLEGQIEQISHGSSHGGSREGDIEQTSHGSSHGGSREGDIEQTSHGSSHGGSVEGQIEQISHGSSHGGSLEGEIEQISHGSSHGGSREGDIEQISHGSSHGGSVEGQIEQISHGSSHDGSLEGQIEHSSHGNSYGGSMEEQTQKKTQESSNQDYSTGSSGSHRYEIHNSQENGNHVSQDTQPQKVETAYDGQYKEGRIEDISDNNQVDNSGRLAPESSIGQQTVETEQVQHGTKHKAKKSSAEEIAAMHLIHELEELVGETSPPEGSTKNPITQQQEIIREIKGLSDSSQTAYSDANDNIRKVNEEPVVETESNHINHETIITPEGNYERTPEKTQVHHKVEVVETPMVKVTSGHGIQGAGHQVTHTEVREERHHHGVSSHGKSTPDPLDLLNLYKDYNHGDFKPGQSSETAEQPRKELKPEIKQAIDNIMRDWEVLPEKEGKPQPPSRQYKITKHVKVTTTTHNHPLVVHPSQTITKTVQTHSFQPSTSHQHRTITHHINIAELLQQLSQLESSPHHRNVTWCEEKIKEFLTELNRKEESGIEINQNVQEETLHHILTQDQTITKEIRHEVGHDAREAVEEEPFVKKTVVELGQNEPTKPPSYWTEEMTKNETHLVAGEKPKESGEVYVEKQENNEPSEINYEASEEAHKAQEESQIFTFTPSPHSVSPLEVLSHQSHTSLEPKEVIPREDETAEENETSAKAEDGVDVEHHGSESEGRTTAPQRQSEIEEFRGEAERHDRPLPPNYKPRDKSEEEENNLTEESGHIEEHKKIDDLSIELPKNDFSHEESKEEEHKSIENLNIDLPAYDGKTSSKEDVKTFIEHEQAAGEQTTPNPQGYSDTQKSDIDQSHGHSWGGSENGNIEEEERNEGQQEEHIVHEINTGEHVGGETKYVVESEHQSSGGGGENGNEEETVEHHSEGREGHSQGGSRTEYEETVEHHKSEGGNGYSGNGASTEYSEQTIHHSGGNHGNSVGGSQTEYTEETVEHHNSGGSHEINYDQLIEELISLESLPGHQAIDKCEEKIRHFLEVLRKQQERGFDQNKAELERLRHLLEEIQMQKQSQNEHGVNPHSPEASTSFWKKIGRKIKTTFEKAKTKAHEAVNDMMH